MKMTLEAFVRSTADGMHDCGQYSAAKTCLSVLRGLLGVAGKGSLAFAELTPALLRAYEHHLLAHERSRNTVSLYMRTLQNLCNRARRAGVALFADDLFTGVFTGSDPVRHRAVAPEVIRKIADVLLCDKDARLAFARDMFMLSFYLRGIPFVDLAHLRKCDMRGDVITYRRRKTGQLASLAVEPCALEIINRYAALTSGISYLLPIIRRRGSADDEQRQYESALRLYNKHLGCLSEKLGLEVRLTSYVARHSWATVAHDIGVDVADISAALCHSSEKMTRNYLESFTPDRLAGVNRCVLQVVLGGDGSNIEEKGRERYKIPWEKFYSGSL